MTIIKRITQIMNEKTLKPADLCRTLGIRQSTYSSWETRNSDPPAKYILLICEFLQVSPEYLLGGTNNPNPTSMTISNNNFNSGNISGDSIQTVNTDETISKRDRQLLKQINSLDFQDYCKVMAYIGELIKK